MISRDLAQALRDAGLRWRPAAGDRFVIPQPGLDEELFTLSEMTIEAREYPTGTILGFNGTTEWALDSVAQEDALWMPREDQLRERLGRAFVSLTRQEVDVPEGATGTSPEPAPQDQQEGGVLFRVTTRGPGGERTYDAGTPADAYGLALLALVQHALADAAT